MHGIFKLHKHQLSPRSDSQGPTKGSSRFLVRNVEAPDLHWFPSTLAQY